MNRFTLEHHWPSEMIWLLRCSKVSGVCSYLRARDTIRLTSFTPHNPSKRPALAGNVGQSKQMNYLQTLSRSICQRLHTHTHMHICSHKLTHIYAHTHNLLNTHTQTHTVLFVVQHRDWTSALGVNRRRKQQKQTPMSCFNDSITKTPSLLRVWGTALHLHWHPFTAT